MAHGYNVNAFLFYSHLLPGQPGYHIQSRLQSRNVLTWQWDVILAYLHISLVLYAIHATVHNAEHNHEDIAGYYCESRLTLLGHFHRHQRSHCRCM